MAANLWRAFFVPGSAGQDTPHGVDLFDDELEEGGNPRVPTQFRLYRLGLMFFPDPARGLREMFRALKPGGRACTMVFSSPDRNPCIAILVATALKHAGLPPRDPCAPGGLLSLGRPWLIDDLFRSAGFREVATTRVAAPFKLPSAADYLDFIRTSGAPPRCSAVRAARPAPHDRREGGRDDGDETDRRSRHP